MKQSYEKVYEKLKLRKQELEQVLARLSQEKLSDDEVQDPADLAATAVSEEINRSIQKTELHEYEKLCKALAAIELGTYGTCMDCGSPIAEKRLLMYPHATRCVACQEIAEERQS